jgi:hypothetical protein
MGRTNLMAIVGTSLLFVSITAEPQTTAMAQCRVTEPGPGQGGQFGDSRLSVLSLWPNGEVVFNPGGAGFITSDGALGMKFGWQRGVRGRLSIEGRRLDAAAPALRSEVLNGYGDLGFQSSYVIFPTPGCWEVTGRVADASVTFITRVVKNGEGPSWRRGL